MFKKIAQNKTLWLAQAIIVVFRFFFRILEVVGPENRRARLREFREKLDQIKRECDVAVAKINNGRNFEGIEAVYELADRYGSPEDRQKNQEELIRLRAMRLESESLKAIHQQAGEDKAAAVEGYRKYIEGHPDSSLAHSYLGGALKKLGDLYGSLGAYREALRLAEKPSVTEAMACLNIGQVLQAKGELEEAVSLYRRVIDDPSLDIGIARCFAYLYLGNALHAQGELDQARSAWKMAAKLDTTKVIAKPVREMLKANP